MLLLCLMAKPVQAFEELQAYGVDLFNAPGQCVACDQGEDPDCDNDLEFAVAQADKFQEIVDTWTTWDGTTDSIRNTATDPADFADVSIHSGWGADEVTDAGIDDADVAYLSTHGNFDCSGGENQSFSLFSMGDENVGEECDLETDDMLIGNTDMELMYLDTCDSARKCVFDNGGYEDLDASGNELILWAGFHGQSRDTAGQVTALGNYVGGSRVSGVGDNWLNDRWINNIFADLDQCPTVIIWGSSGINKGDMFTNGGIEDWIDTGTHTSGSFFFITNCDPPLPGNTL